MTNYEYRIDYHCVTSPTVLRSHYVNATSKIQAIRVFEYHKPNSIVRCVTKLDKKKVEEKIMELKGKISVELTEDDIKEIIAEYANGFTGFGNVTKDNVEFEYGTVEVGTQMCPETKTVLKKCKIRM